jgi:hypothetical protein
MPREPFFKKVDTQCTRVYYCTMDIRVRDIEPKLHLAFKVTCTANQTTMNDVIVKLIAEYVKREGKAPYNPQK